MCAPCCVRVRSCAVCGRVRELLSCCCCKERKKRVNAYLAAVLRLLLRLRLRLRLLTREDVGLLALRRARGEGVLGEGRGDERSIARPGHAGAAVAAVAATAGVFERDRSLRGGRHHRWRVHSAAAAWLPVHHHHRLGQAHRLR
jgi:hypothetical protein